MAEIHNYFEGWAVIELFGHGKAIGFVTTEYFGTACMFRCDTPEREAREFILDKPRYGLDPEGRTEKYLPIGTKVKREAVPARSRLLGPGSIFAINPTTQALAIAQLDIDEPRPLICLEIPEKYRQKELLPGEPQPIVEAISDDQDDGEYEDEEPGWGEGGPRQEAS
jgi:hypothetical protein